MPNADLPSSLELHVGDDTSIALPALGVTGHSWNTETSGPAGIVETRMVRGSPAAGSPVAVGVANVQVLHVKASSAGNVVVRLSVRRPWERDVAAIRSHEIAVRVV